VHPPVRTEFFTPDPSIDREDWLLVVAALEPYKRTELVIEAANRAGLWLKVVGDGTQREALAAMAGPTVEMLGRLDDDALRDHYRRARGLVFPQLEDFGIIAVEAQACGCPVIAFDGGGARETVTDEPGVRFAAPTVEGLSAAIDEFDRRDFDASVIRANAERFSEARFDEAMVREVARLLPR
jgi:glycosyltransferase involved in cell wall biosynthesis